MRCLLGIIVCLLVASCDVSRSDYPPNWPGTNMELPGLDPIPFSPRLTPDSMLIHRGIFSPDYLTYYFTLSDKNFNRFDVMCSEYRNGAWTASREASFNSAFSEHGMSFSPDGNSILFSSTRPAGRGDVADTWHLWKVQKNYNSWGPPTYIDIPNMRERLVSHPSVTKEGVLYFHASNLDYSDMQLYFSELKNDGYQEAQRVNINADDELGSGTPFISPSGDYLVYAGIGAELELYISHLQGPNQWTTPRKLPASINTNGQGNPYVTPDSKYLFYAKEQADSGQWGIYWVSVARLLKN